MSELGSRLQRRFGFPKQELFHIFISAVVASFILTLKVVDLANNYILNLVAVIIITFLTLLIHFSAQKIVALHLGYASKYKYWLNGFFISILVGFFTWGYIPLFFTGVFNFDDIPKLRAGRFLPSVMQKDLAVIGFAGPLANMLIVAVLTPFYLASGNKLVYVMIIVNLLTAVFSLLPIPTFEQMKKFKGGTTGLYIFIASRTAFVVIFFAVLSFSLMIMLFKVFSYILALFIGLIVGYIYKKYFD